MSKFNSDKVMPRYLVIAAFLTLAGLVVIGKAGYTMTAKKDYWEVVSQRMKNDTVKKDLPVRGNILSDDGKLLSASLPKYLMFIDFKAGNLPDTAKWVRKRDSIWYASLDTICHELSVIFPSRSESEFKAHLTKGHDLKKQYWLVWPRAVDHNIYAIVRELPYFNLGPNRGGFSVTRWPSRRHPFGTMAQRTVGLNNDTTGAPKCGLELFYDSLLAGRPGKARRIKVREGSTTQVIEPAVDGADIVTTIDVDMQDLVERCLSAQLKEIGGEMGVAAVMEVKTGDVKAIASLERVGSGDYIELMNRAVGYRCEPGSVFKTASFMVALDDGVVDTSYVIHTGNGIMPMHGAMMKDHNWRNKGYKDISVLRALEVSSNIGVSYVIDTYYRDHPERYVEGLRRVGIAEDLKLPIVGYHAPDIRMPKRNKRGQYTNWSKTTLPWMSIGYETRVAPINTLAFYNAIANNGRLMQPRFVQRIVYSNGEVEECPPVALKEHIAKPQTVKIMQEMLERVVSHGLGKRAGSPSFLVAGKTGTAQVANGALGYKGGIVTYWLSFAGYFPADNPRYSCIVCIKNRGGVASGGLISGTVFHQISEGIMSKHLKLLVQDARDSTSILVPEVKNGNLHAADYVLTQLGISTDGGWGGNHADAQPLWGRSELQNKSRVRLTETDLMAGQMPDVSGMGARDAVYLLESLGLRVHLTGTGHVKSQSISKGTMLHQGMVCQLHLG